MVTLPGGTFTMGDGTRANERPTRRVTVSPFALAAAEVTQGQLRAVLGEREELHDRWPDDARPAGHVSWYQAVEFLNRLSQYNGLTPAYTIDPASPVPDTPRILWDRAATGYRLPTEAEWEYAARAGTTTDTPTGNLAGQGGACAPEAVLDRQAWYCANGVDGGQVGGRLSASPLGLYDMLGNVWEWVWDWLPGFEVPGYPAGDVSNPTGADGNGQGGRLLRGGSWYNTAVAARASARIAHIVNAHYSHVDFGFRIAGPPGAPAPRFPPTPIRVPRPAVVPDSAPIPVVRLPGGTFAMGPDLPQPDKRQVTVGPFVITATEITQGQYVAVMGPSANHSMFVGARLPVTNISWYDAVAFANALSAREGRTPAYAITTTDVRPGGAYDVVRRIPGATGWRLATEAEWEYAARAGTTTVLPNGARTTAATACGADARLEEIAWYCRNAGGRPREVGTRAPNGWGVSDMLGNVSEWVWDYFDPLPPGPLVDPQGPAQSSMGPFRVVRGGSYLGAPQLLASGARGPHVVNGFYGHADYGIRLVRAP
jgi:formylglycine-generating enzyme required for sulfatase activity